MPGQCWGFCMVNVATESQHEIVRALQYLYAEDVEIPPEVADSINLPGEKGEITGSSIDDIVPAAVLMQRKHGQYNALQFLYYNFRRMEKEGGTIDKWIFLLLVEHGEVGGLFSDGHPDAAVLRGCAFFDHYFRELTDWHSYLDTDEDESDLSLARLINMATYDEEQLISPTERKLFHYVRHVRNDIAHHSWLAKEYTYDAVFTAARIQLYLIGELVQREVTAAGIELPQPPEEIDPETEYIETIEQDYGWEYQEEEYYWETNAIDERPPL